MMIERIDDKQAVARTMYKEKENIAMEIENTDIQREKIKRNQDVLESSRKITLEINDDEQNIEGLKVEEI